jgi:hypothetical protein
MINILLRRIFMYKKIIAGVLAVTLTVGGLGLPAEVIADVTGGTAISVSADTYGDYEYAVLDDGTIRIVGYNGDDTTLKIPSKINGKTVTIIGGDAFFNCTSLKSITIPNGVTSIYGEAFLNCTSLESITIPGSVTSIGSYAFDNTKWLENKRKENPLVIVNGLLIDAATCSGNVVIPDSVTSIEIGAFSNCTNLTGITIPNSVKSIGEIAFYYCTNLKSVSISDSVTDIGGSAFASCESLTSITIPKGITGIKAGTFSDCTSLKSITIPSNITYIESSAFFNCPKIKSVTIPKTVKKIGDEAFGYYVKTSAGNIKNSGRGGGSWKMDNFKISCYSGTAGEKYAKENGFSYVLLDSPSVSVDRVTTNGFTSKTNSVTIKWKKVSGASGYRIYRYNTSTKKWDTVTTIKSGSTLSYTQSGLKAGTIYKYKVKAYVKKSGATTWGDSSATLTTATTPAMPKFSKTSSSKTSVRLYWNKVSGADNYKLQKYDTAQKKWVTVNAKIDSSVTNYKVTGLKKNTSYKFRIQAYKKAGSTKVYSEWSATRTVKTKN